MMFFCVLFLPPLYFLIRGKWLPFAINCCFYGTAWLCVFLFFIGLIFFAPVFWGIAVAHASWYLRLELMSKHADMIASKMAEKMRENQLPPKIPTR
jgi:hypothetical protein